MMDELVFNIQSEYYAKDVTEFDPYTNNGGSVVAIAGKDYAIIASDTRLCSATLLCTRRQSKLFTLTNSAVMGCTGCWCDSLTLSRVLRARLEMYRYDHPMPITSPSIAQMLSNMLYYKRFFPYYVIAMLAGLDTRGAGCVYSFDPIGHCERSTFKAIGSSGALLQPLLDNQVGKMNMPNEVELFLPKDMALCLVKDLFIAAAERDCHVGDNVHLNIITRHGVAEDHYPLRRD